MADNYSHTKLAEQLLSNLRKKFRKLERQSRISRVLLFTGILLIGFSLLILIEKWLFLSVLSKSVAWAVILLAALGAALWISRDKSHTGFTHFYRSFCEKHDFADLENALDLYLDPSEEKSGLHLLAIENNLQRLDHEKLNEQLRRFTSRHLKHRTFLSALSVMLISLLLAGTASWSNPDSATRSLSFWQEFEKPNPYEFVVVPGDTTIEHGTSFEPEIRITGGRTALPGRVSLAIKTDIEEEYRYRPMEQSGDRTFRSRPVEMTSDATYYIRLDEYPSDTHKVNVQLRPRFEALTVNVSPPSYTGLSSDSLDYPFAVLRAYGGSEITIEGTANKPLDEISLKLGDEQLEMAPVDDAGDSLRYRTSFTFTENDTASFHLSDQDGLTNRNPFRFRVSKLEDEYPVVVIREPEGNITEAEPERLDIFYQAADDFGLTGARLNWELQRAFAPEPERGSRDLETPVIGEPSHIPWELEDLGLRPRDRLTFWVTVWDNDEFNGFKSTDSQQLVLEVPSVSAFLDNIDRQERSVQDGLDEISESFRQMEEEYQRFKDRLKQNQEPGWEEDQMLEDIQDRQQDVEESIQRLNEQFDEIRREMEGSNQVSEETRRAYQELQDLMEQLDDPELQKALEELRRSLQDLNMQDLERAMEDFEFNERVYKERLERTLELFKTLKMNSDLDKLAAQYEDLAERMESVSQEDKSPQEQRDEQQGVREDTDHIKNQLEQLDDRPPRRAEERLRQLKEETGMELQDIQDRLDQLIEESGNGNGEGDPGEMQQQQQELSQQMQQRADALREAQQQMGGQQIQVNLHALQQSLYTLLELSESQEELTKLTNRTESRSQGYVELARDQQNIKSQFEHVADTLFRVTSEIPSLSNQINRKKAEIERTLSNSVEQMAEREQRQSVIMSRESLGGLNDLASMLAEAIDQLMDQQSGQGGGMSMQQMMEQMQNMSGEQEMMNEQLQQLINDMQGERLTQEESERLEQLAQQQNEIRRQLERMQRSGALREGDRTLSELQRMSEQMEDAINDMRGGMTDPLMIERQQNILSRMLDAEESLQQRGEAEDEYEGRRPEDYERTMPPDVTLEELQQEIRTRLQDPQYTRFRDDYQRLIERYFELLRRFEERPLP